MNGDGDDPPDPAPLERPCLRVAAEDHDDEAEGRASDLGPGVAVTESALGEASASLKPAGRSSAADGDLVSGMVPG